MTFDWSNIGFKGRQKGQRKPQAQTPLKPYLSYLDYTKEEAFEKLQSGTTVSFEKAPVNLIKKLMNGEPNINPYGRQNESPTAKRMVEIAEDLNGKLGGYIVPVQSGRPDCRIQLTTLYIPDEADARMLEESHIPDDFSEDGKYWRLWWD